MREKIQKYLVNRKQVQRGYYYIPCQLPSSTKCTFEIYFNSVHSIPFVLVVIHFLIASLLPVSILAGLPDSCVAFLHLS